MPGTFTPFVKPHQVLSYLDVAIPKIHKTRMQFVIFLRPCFVSETCEKWLPKYLVSESRGAPKDLKLHTYTYVATISI